MAKAAVSGTAISTFGRATFTAAGAAIYDALAAMAPSTAAPPIPTGKRADGDPDWAKEQRSHDGEEQHDAAAGEHVAKRGADVESGTESCGEK